VISKTLIQNDDMNDINNEYSNEIDLRRNDLKIFQTSERVLLNIRELR
jgi:hypothetical protein